MVTDLFSLIIFSIAEIEALLDLLGGICGDCAGSRIATRIFVPADAKRVGGDYFLYPGRMVFESFQLSIHCGACDFGIM